MYDIRIVEIRQYSGYTPGGGRWRNTKVALRGCNFLTGRGIFQRDVVYAKRCGTGDGLYVRKRNLQFVFLIKFVPYQRISLIQF